MPDISIYFHALPDELIPLVKESVTEMGLRVSAVSFPPWQVRLLESDEIATAIMAGHCRQLILSEEEPCLDVLNQNDFAEKNPGLLYLDIGRHSAGGLK